MSGAARWSVVVLVLAVAGAVALWPRSSGPADQGAPATRSRPGPDLATARERAALRPCPQTPDAPGAPAQLRGVVIGCLGDGRPVDVAAAAPGRALVNFWATWCVPCQGELKVLEEYSREPGAAPVITVLVDSKEADGLELMAKLGVRLPSVVDPDDAVRKAVRAPRTLPMSYVVGADGALAQLTDPTVLTSVDQVREVVG
ncbi:TlpA family protein disulfide reductase [Saccharothrix sp. HUAS TT1]|uniref:TlpA family protein disulfide reductase n=1 Tax=unclassified Saccharothrix TaxID=2593673 RepID=UPI00345B4CA5